MKVPILKKSLCGCNLRTGSLCVAYTYLLACLLIFAFYIYMVCTSAGWYLHTLYAEGLCVGFQIAATIYLLVGLYKKNREHISKWILISIIIGIIISLEFLEVAYFSLFYYDTVSIVIIVILAVIIGLKIYALLIVYSYSLELSEVFEKHAEYRADEVQLV